jgi:molybdenum cofactor biosynthesis enzyme MoaA
MSSLPILQQDTQHDVQNDLHRGEHSSDDPRRVPKEAFDATLPQSPPWPHTPTIEWQVVGQCNYDCSYCIQSKKHRQGISDDDDLRGAIDFFATLPTSDAHPRWEIKTTGGEPFSFRGFLHVVVPGLMDKTPHRMGTLTNLSAPPRILKAFAKRTYGRLSIVSASLHLEHTGVSPFLQRLAALRDAVADDARIVVNCVLVPDQLEAVREAQRAVVAAGFRFFPQLMKVKGGVFAYRPEQWTQVKDIVGDLADAAATRSANLAPAYSGRRCYAGARYFVVTKTGDAWSCRTAKRHDEGFLGNVLHAPRDVRLHPGARPCPYTICPCATPANRGMIEGVAGTMVDDDEDG